MAWVQHRAHSNDFLIVFLTLGLYFLHVNRNLMPSGQCLIGTFAGAVQPHEHWRVIKRHIVS